MVTLVPAVLAILRVALMFRGGYFVRFRRRQLGVIAKANTVFAVGQIGLAPGYGYFPGFRLGQFGVVAGASAFFTLSNVALFCRD